MSLLPRAPCVGRDVIKPGVGVGHCIIERSAADHHEGGVVEKNAASQLHLVRKVGQLTKT